MYQQNWVDVFINYYTPYQVFLLWNDYFSWVLLLERQRVAQDDFDNTLRTFSIRCRPTNIFNLSFIFLLFLFLVSLIVSLECILWTTCVVAEGFLEINITAIFEIPEKISVF